MHITESKTHSLGQRVILVFSIVQHVRDVNLMKRLKEFLNCGNLYKKRETFQLMVTKLEDIVTIIIPFFKKYPIRGVKGLEFADFCKVAELMNNKKHLTEEGLEQIRQIKAGMNTGRK